MFSINSNKYDIEDKNVKILDPKRFTNIGVAEKPININNDYDNLIHKVGKTKDWELIITEEKRNNVSPELYEAMMELEKMRRAGISPI